MLRSGAPRAGTVWLGWKIQETNYKSSAVWQLLEQASVFSTGATRLPVTLPSARTEEHLCPAPHLLGNQVVFVQQEWWHRADVSGWLLKEDGGGERGNNAGRIFIFAFWKQIFAEVRIS